MMTHRWIYDGELDAAGRVLTLNSEGSGFSGESTLAKYQEIIAVKSPDHRILPSRTQGADGTWTRS